MEYDAGIYLELKAKLYFEREWIDARNVGVNLLRIIASGPILNSGTGCSIQNCVVLLLVLIWNSEHCLFIQDLLSKITLDSFRLKLLFYPENILHLLNSNTPQSVIPTSWKGILHYGAHLPFGLGYKTYCKI